MTCSISFAGCGFLMSYHVGVAMCLRQYAPEMIRGKICSTSSGLLVAVALICDIPLGVITTEILRITNLARSYTLGPLDPRFNLHKSLEEVLRNHLPDDAHERASGRLFISLTRIRDKTNVILSHFEYREQLIKAVLAGCFIPTYSGFLPQPYRGVRYIDGSVTNNLPVIDQNTIRVSPFSGEADICPSTSSNGGASGSGSHHANVVNMVVDVTEANLSRFFRVFIPQDPRAMIRLCQQGFDDALGYLQSNKKTVQAKSFLITSTFLLLDGGGGEQKKKGDETDRESSAAAARLLTNSNKFKRNSTSNLGLQWKVDVEEGEGQDVEDFNRIGSSVLSPSESVLKQLSLSEKRTDHNNHSLQLQGDDYNSNLETKTIRPVDLIEATLKSIAGQSLESRAFQMRLPKYEPPLDSKTAAGHVSAYFQRYLLHPVTQLLSEKICEASRVVLDKVNKRVNVEALTELLLKRPEHSSAPEDIRLLKQILQMTNELTPFETIYYIEESNKIHVTELFDISDCEDTDLQTAAERELNQMLEFDIDDWGDAEFGGEVEDDEGIRGERGWDDDFPDDDLFPVEERQRPEVGQDSFVRSSDSSGKEFDRVGMYGLKNTKAGDDVGCWEEEEDKDTAEELDHDPYFFSDMASKALNMSQEYNEMLFGTFRQIDEEDEDEEGLAGVLLEGESIDMIRQGGGDKTGDEGQIWGFPSE